MGSANPLLQRGPGRTQGCVASFCRANMEQSSLRHYQEWCCCFLSVTKKRKRKRKGFCCLQLGLHLLMSFKKKEVLVYFFTRNVTRACKISHSWPFSRSCYTKTPDWDTPVLSYSRNISGLSHENEALSFAFILSLGPLIWFGNWQIWYSLTPFPVHPAQRVGVGGNATLCRDFNNHVCLGACSALVKGLLHRKDQYSCFRISFWVNSTRNICQLKLKF